MDAAKGHFGPAFVDQVGLFPLWKHNLPSSRYFCLVIVQFKSGSKKPAGHQAMAGVLRSAIFEATNMAPKTAEWHPPGQSVPSSVEIPAKPPLKPEEQELARKREEFLALEAELADRELVRPICVRNYPSSSAGTSISWGRDTPNSMNGRRNSPRSSLASSQIMSVFSGTRVKRARAPRKQSRRPEKKAPGRLARSRLQPK